jgi:curved DNA-binding protein CbpA
MSYLNLPPDPYAILGVSKDAKIQDIRLAHRKLVLKCHPDRVQDYALKAVKLDEYQRVQLAYELLSDDNRRQQYDELQEDTQAFTTKKSNKEKKTKRTSVVDSEEGITGTISPSAAAAAAAYRTQGDAEQSQEERPTLSELREAETAPRSSSEHPGLPESVKEVGTVAEHTESVQEPEPVGDPLEDIWGTWGFPTKKSKKDKKKKRQSTFDEYHSTSRAPATPSEPTQADQDIVVPVNEVKLAELRKEMHRGAPTPPVYSFESGDEVRRSSARPSRRSRSRTIDKEAKVQEEIWERNRKAYENLKAGAAEASKTNEDETADVASKPESGEQKEAQKPAKAMLSSVPPSQLGLKILNPERVDVCVDIVAVHGLGAIPEITWKDSKSGKTWISDSEMLPKSVPEARIMRFGYDSLWLGKTPIRTKLSTIANKLLLVLARERSVRHQVSKSIFISLTSAGSSKEANDLHWALLRWTRDRTGNQSSSSSEAIA